MQSLRWPSILCLLALSAAGCEQRAASATAPATAPADMVLIPAGSFRIGTEDGFPYERPVHQVSIKSFWMDRHEVTVRQFQQFTRATGYKTDAEKWGWSGVFDPK